MSGATLELFLAVDWIDRKLPSTALVQCKLHVCLWHVDLCLCIASFVCTEVSMGTGTKELCEYEEHSIEQSWTKSVT